MQRKICSVVGACGLIFTFNATAQSAGGGGAAGGGGSSAAASTGASAGRAATVAAPRAAATTTAPRAAATAQNINATTPSQPVNGASSSTATTANGQIGQPTLPGQLPAGSALPGQTPATGISGQTAAGTTAGATVTATTPTTTAVPFNSLPAAVQSSLASQIPAGARLGQITQETTPQGTTTFRAQVMQNGVVSEISLAGANGGTTVQPLNGTATAGTVGTANGFGTSALNNTALGTTAGTAGFVVGTPYSFETLPMPVQNAFSSQSGGTMVTNVTYMAGPAGGVFRGFADGRQMEVRVGANGQILPGIPRVVAAGNTSTNEMKIDDVPMAVRDAIKGSAPYAEVTKIRKSESASGNLFDVTLRGDGQETTMQISENGTVLKQDSAPVSLATTTTTTSAAITPEPPKLILNALPELVRDAIEVRTKRDSVKSLVLTNYLGKTTYAVDFVDENALRNRYFISKEGLVVATQTNLFRIAQSGTPVALGDLPATVRVAIDEQAPNAAIMRVDQSLMGETPVYIVSYLKDGETRQMTVTRDGARLDSVGAAATTEIGRENK